MIKIAIVEDEESQARLLEEYLNRYAEEKKIQFKIQKFTNAVSLLENYSADYDIIFMDIRMPYMNGMDAAHRLRKLDKTVLLIFMTSLTQYAISGYEVEALDYIVKPIGYYDFALKMSRAMQRIPKDSPDEIVVSTVNGMVKLSPSDIRFLETEGHHVIYHTADADYRQYGTLSSAEAKLQSYNFCRCNNCYLVNLQYVESIQGYTVTVDGKELRISQPRKKAFVQQLLDYTKRKTTCLN
ncbi:LytR/AlgR family response regulator transcription factor [Anaerobium acetethylicum]|uniref:Stage 0 sporulation protein A homolog n=1 Tax=Anaerobium acetethylicum TaxID=1619234 RepID=A0A1D3TW42_9FIRM|nr:LytTR family DNA-binding domain-containing protein [Anaerobium acetethylicum]SCP98431.1 DNA-binding response regulator, LytR/AlgR family [Anaerobium acetethylicum]